MGAEREWVQFCGKMQDKAAKHRKWKEILKKSRINYKKSRKIFDV